MTKLIPDNKVIDRSLVTINTGSPTQNMLFGDAIC